MAIYLGLDLGGTNIKAGVVNDAGAILAKTSVPTPTGRDAVVQAIAQAARAALADAGLSIDQVRRACVGSPGPIDMKRGIVMDAPNLPGFRNMPLAARMTDLLGRPTVIENDANAAAFGEYWAGAGRDPNVRHLIMLTLGTGIGGGVVIDGRVLHGGFGFAAEIGHTILIPDGRPCGCGQRGCLEAYASASAAARRAAEAIADGQPSTLTSIDQNKLTAEDVFDAARHGDKLADRLVQQTADYLGLACVNLTRTFDPQMIIFAGGMSLAGDLLFDPLRRAFERYTWRLTDTTVTIAPAELGNDTGIIGAAGIAWSLDQDGPVD